MKNSIVSLLLLGFSISLCYAEPKTAEDLVSSMKKADMTYRQLMETMGKSSTIMHEGILRENKQMVEYGANFIFTHPAPNHKPWSIMKKEDQAAFKQSLLSFDKILDQHTRRIVEASNNDDWFEASKASNELMTSCMTCHSMWLNKVK